MINSKIADIIKNATNAEILSFRKINKSSPGILRLDLNQL
jgi:hypothetical protein